MSTESLKLQLIEHLLRTTDEGLLKKVADLFRSERTKRMTSRTSITTS